MNKNDRELKQYFKAIKKETHIYANSSRFLKDLKNGIYSYISENPDVTMDNIFNKYGTSEELANEFFQQENAEIYKKKLSLSKYIKWGLGICFALFIILLSVLFIDRQFNQPVTVEYTIETNS